MLINCEIKKLLLVVLAIQLIMLALVALSNAGITITGIQPIIGFINLTIIPGLLLVRILKLHKLSGTEVLLYAVGLSISFIIFLGLFMNTFYPYMGIDRPLSLWTIAVTISVAQIILSILAYVIDRAAPLSFKFNLGALRLPSLQTLSFILIPLISILGARIVSSYNSNILLIILVLLIALIPLFVVFTRLIPDKLYPLAIVSISVAILYSASLITDYLTGIDIHPEYQLARLVQINSVWDSTIFHPYSSMLSVVVLAPIYSYYCGMELIWIFKIIYPLLYVIVPLGIYRVCEQQLGKKIAFLSAFFFISVYVQFTNMVSLVRQEIAEVFLVLLLLIIVSKSINPLARTIMLLLFSASLAVSHYAISYLFAFYLILLLIVQPLFSIIYNYFALRRQRKKHQVVSIDKLKPVISRDMLSPGIVAFFIIICLSWYIWQSGSYNFIVLVHLSQHVYSNVLNDFFSILSSQALFLIASPAESVFHEIVKYINLFTIFLIAIGITDLLINWKRGLFDREYSILAIVTFISVAATIPLPYISNALETTRLYHLNLVFLAPFCVTGTAAIFRFVSKRCKKVTVYPLGIASITLALLLVFNSGLAHELGRSSKYSYSLLQQSVRTYGDEEGKAKFYGTCTVETEAFSARWLSENNTNTQDIKVYATFVDPNNVGPPISYGLISGWNLKRLEKSTEKIETGAYVYLGYLNTAEQIGTMILPNYDIETFDIYELQSILEPANKIYASQGSQILLGR